MGISPDKQNIDAVFSNTVHQIDFIDRFGQSLDLFKKRY